MTVCCTAVLALALAGCSGGGAGSSTGSEPVTVDPALIEDAIGIGSKPVTVTGSKPGIVIAGTVAPFSVGGGAAPFKVDGGVVTEKPPTPITTDDFTKTNRSGATIEGWDGTVYERSEMDGGSTVVTTVVNYTDIEGTADTAYMDLAYWLKSTEADDGTIDYEIGTLAHGNQDTGYGGLSGVTGTAKYAGPATGWYVRNTAAGQFTANARFTASFQGQMGGSIRGVVDGFKNRLQKLINPSWKLTLVSPTDFQGDEVFVGVATGTGAPGTWRGRFEGDSTGGATIPTAVTGVFHGHFSDGHVAGAFGATEQ